MKQVAKGRWQHSNRTGYIPIAIGNALAGILFLSVMACSKHNPVPPILILTGHSGFGIYTGEILKAEGFNEFMIDSVTSNNVTKSFLSEFDIVILPDQTIDASAKKLISDYVNEGGDLIAFRPDSGLVDLFGIATMPGNIAGGHICIDTTASEGKSLAGKSLQFHGTGEKIKVINCRIIASFCADSGMENNFPAVVSGNYGKGRSVAFLYDLPKSIVLNRQGNPLSAGIEKDGIPGLRGMDLFTDGWLDTSNSVINQADEQMMLLSHCIEKLTIHKTPLPRLWYFPDSLKCLVTLTNDGEFRGEDDFETQFRDVDSLGAKMSLYILDIDKVSKNWVDKWSAKGFEIAGHPDDTKEAANPGWYDMNDAIVMKKNEIEGKYGLPMRTNVNHWFVWCGTDADGKQDFTAAAKLEEKNGIELDMNYAHYDIKSNQGADFLGPAGTNQGNFTGSGLIMKFADINGHLVNVYQHLNAVYDQEYTERRDPEGFYNCFKGLMDRSLNDEVYSFISVKCHNDEYYFSKTPLMKMLSYSNLNGIPVWTALKLLDFIKMRDEACFSDINWKNSKLSFSLNSALKHTNGLTFMVPYRYGDKKIAAISCDEKNMDFDIRSVRGNDYAFLTVKAGQNHSILVDYND
jgi:hypothetical protein